MGTFAAGHMLEEHTGRPIAAQVVQVLAYPTDLPVTPVDGPVVTGARGGYGQFTVPDLDAVTLAASDGKKVGPIASVEAQVAAGTAGPFLESADQRLTVLESRSGTYVSPNLLNPDTGTPEAYWGGAVGTTPTPIAGYWASGLIPVTPGQQYTVQNVRTVQWFDSTGTSTIELYNAGYVNDATFATKTVTAPAGAAFMAVSTTNARKSTAMVEKGATASPWVPYGSTSLGEMKAATDELQARVGTLEDAPVTRHALTVHKSGDVILLRHGLDSTRDMLIPLSLNTSGFPGGEPRVRMTNTALASTSTIPAATKPDQVWPALTATATAFHATVDDNAPVYVGGSYIGSNHGWLVTRLTATGHGKTTADLGSQWTDGTRTYTLLRVPDANTVWLGFPYTVTSGRVSLTVVLPAAQLTHVSGATSTTALPITGGMGLEQFRPSSHSRTLTAALDDAPLRDGVTEGRVLLITETYTTVSYKGLIDWAQANIGQNPAGAVTSLPSLATLSTTWRWEGRTCIVGQTLTAIEPLAGFMMVTQANGLTAPAGGSVRQFFPGATGTASGLNLATEANLAGQTADVTVQLVHQADAADPIARAYQWRYTSAGARDVGLLLGLLPVMDGKPATRKANGTDSASWYMPNSTKKNYPRLTGPSHTLAAGQSRSGVAFRRYLSAEDKPGVVIRDGSRSWVLLDSPTAAPSGSVAPLPEAQGRALAVVGSTNVATGTVVTPAGLTYAHPAPGRYIAEAVIDTTV